MWPKREGKISNVDTLEFPVHLLKEELMHGPFSISLWKALHSMWIGVNIQFSGPDDELHGQTIVDMSGAPGSYFRNGPARSHILEYSLAEMEKITEASGCG